MKYYLIAGEASGDLHGSNLMKALQKTDPEADFRFFGGDLMQNVGGTLVKHYREMAFMGFIPVLLNLRTIMNNMRTCEKDIQVYKPDVVILIDYPGFNLKIAKYVKEKLHIPVYYYISPKIWAWKKYRIKDIRKYVDRMFCILPFEKEFYQKMEYTIDYVGNPSVDAVTEYKKTHPASKEKLLTTTQIETNKPIIALLAGSRKQEIKDNLPTMLNAIAAFPEYHPVIAGAPGIDPEYYKTYIGTHKVDIIFNNTFALLQHSEAALVTSGTATLETALFKVPQVVCYYTPVGNIVNFVFKNFFHIHYISLVNLIGNREIVQELFGKRFSLKNIQSELNKILNDSSYHENMLNGYEEVIQTLGPAGASIRAAELIYTCLSS